jgi:CrcB protein
MNWLLVFLGGGLGSIARYGVTLLTKQFHQGNWPWATFIANLLACILLVALVYLISPTEKEESALYAFLAVGFCGGFSTFSTFSYETSMLIQNGNWGLAFLNIFVSMTVGLGLFFFLTTKR